MTTIEDQCRLAYKASHKLGTLSTEKKNAELQTMAKAILENSDQILSANQKDIEAGKTAGMSNALLDRLLLTTDRLKGIAESIHTIASLPDPIGNILNKWNQPNGLHIQKIRVPIGVIGIIYEARPNVTADAIALCLKAGSSVVLRGSSSAYQSNKAISEVMKSACEDPDAIQLLEDTSREGVLIFVKMKKYLSLIIPRGGASLIQNVVENATVPTIETGIGNCHIYVDQYADLDNALPIIINAKTQRPSVCNACETVLVHKNIASSFLPKMVKALKEKGVEIRGCQQTLAITPDISSAQETDWSTEYLDLILAVKIVDSVQEAIEHIRTYGSLHTETILSGHKPTIELFQQSVDAAAIVSNASSRFIDGGEFGFGAEMGISTQKLHARGPMGLPELTTYKYLVIGNGQIRT
ncbi:glutamate-5-semialdehyde dehydrogenase [Thermoproteota archaeon]